MPLLHENKTGKSKQQNIKKKNIKGQVKTVPATKIIYVTGLQIIIKNSQLVRVTAGTIANLPLL